MLFFVFVRFVVYQLFIRGPCWVARRPVCPHRAQASRGVAATRYNAAIVWRIWRRCGTPHGQTIPELDVVEGKVTSVAISGPVPGEGERKWVSEDH